MKPRRFLLAGAIALAATAFPAQAQLPPGTNVSVNGARALEIDANAGDISVVPDPLLKVVQVFARSGRSNVRVPLEISHPPELLRIAIDGTAPSLLPFAGGNGREYEVRYPPAMRLVVKEYGGNVRVGNAVAPIEIYNANGNIVVGEVRSHVTALADDGNVYVAAAYGSVDLSAGVGNVDVVLGPGWSGSLVRLEAAKGNLHLTVPSGFKGRYDATTGRGTVTNPFHSVLRAPLVFMLVENGNVTISSRKGM